MSPRAAPAARPGSPTASGRYMLALGPPPPRSPRRRPARSLRPGRAPPALPDLGSPPTPETPPPHAPPTASALPHFRLEALAGPKEGDTKKGDSLFFPKPLKRPRVTPGPSMPPQGGRSTPAYPSPSHPLWKGAPVPPPPIPSSPEPFRAAREWLQLFNSAAIFRVADFPACLAIREAGHMPLGRDRVSLQSGFWARCHLASLSFYSEPQGNPFLVTFYSGWAWRRTPV